PARHGYRHQHVGQNRRGGACAALRVPLPLQALRGHTPMAKLAVKLRNEKRRKTVEKFKAKRAALLDIIQDPRASDEAREEARGKLQRLPRDASPVRLRNRC